MLADGFEEAEALVPGDILRRAGVEVFLTSITKSETVTGGHGIKILADTNISKVNFSSLEALVLPGGAKGTELLGLSDEVKKLKTDCAAAGKYIAAICAAPSILGKLGLLSGRRAVCYPSFEKYLEGSIITGNTVEHDDIFITAKAAGVSFDFGLELVRILVGSDEAEKLRRDMHYGDKQNGSR